MTVSPSISMTRYLPQNTVQYSTLQYSTAPALEDPLLPGQLPAVLGLAAGAPLGVDQAQVRLARQVGRQVVSVHNRCLGLPVGLKTKQSF